MESWTGWCFSGWKLRLGRGFSSVTDDVRNKGYIWKIPVHLERNRLDMHRECERESRVNRRGREERKTG